MSKHFRLMELTIEAASGLDANPLEVIDKLISEEDETDLLNGDIPIDC